MTSNQDSLRIAVILPRFGKSLGGGAETLAGSLAAQLASGAFGSFTVEIWTTCANDHRTWENFHPEGTTSEMGMQVHRFPVDERDLETFIRAEMAVREGRPLSIEEQLNWLESGVNSRALYSHIAEHGTSFDALLFAPYLFPTSFWGPLIHPQRSILLPCLHDEAYAYFEVFSHVFSAVRGLIFNAEPELELARSIYGLEDLDAKSAVVGMGFEEPIKLSSRANPEAPYLLCSGRKETGKNLDLLLDWFEAYRKENPQSTLELRLIGSGEIDFRSDLPSGVCDLGFVSEEEKLEQMQSAIALCQLSTNESFSIVLMESWLQSTPVLVHGDCAVTKHHVLESSGGLHCCSELEFSACVKRLEHDTELRTGLGAAGKRYVEKVYSWDAVIDRFLKALKSFNCGTERDASTAALQTHTGNE